MKISYSDVEAYCNELHALAQNIKENMENIESIGNKITDDNTWSGMAADHYAKRLRSVTKKFDDIYIEIENSILFMASCAEGYQAIDQNIIKEICSNLNITEPNLETSKIFNGG